MLVSINLFIELLYKFHNISHKCAATLLFQKLHTPGHLLLVDVFELQ